MTGDGVTVDCFIVDPGDSLNGFTCYVVDNDDGKNSLAAEEVLSFQLRHSAVCPLWKPRSATSLPHLWAAL